MYTCKHINSTLDIRSRLFALKYMPKMTTTDMPKDKIWYVGLNYSMLVRNSYTSWSLKMKVFMQVQGVWEAVEPDNPKVAVAVRTDEIALVAIYQGLL